MWKEDLYLKGGGGGKDNNKRTMPIIKISPNIDLVSMLVS